ncbi:MAG: hypothetical protein IT290_12440, partial [Deltaproteobacteria bacterium]|nr:hypothetical protein [Deltaproteobacteria bacterium]
MAATNTVRSLLTKTKARHAPAERRGQPSDLHTFFTDPRSYPLDFAFERTVTQDDSLYVLGRERTWKFSHEEFAGARKAPLLQRIEDAVEELALAQTLTPEMYEGIRVFSVAHGVPVPLHDEPIGDTSKLNRSLRGAQTICLSLHRVFHARTLGTVCREDAELAHSLIPRIARRLRELHQTPMLTKRRASVRWTLESSRAELRVLLEWVRARGHDSSVLDELERFASGALSALTDRFRTRALSGLLTLPALTLPKNTIVGRFLGGADQLFIFPDRRGVQGASVGDPLREVSRFVVSLDLWGHSDESARLVSIYGKQNPLFDPEILRLHIVLECLELAASVRSEKLTIHPAIECAARYAFGMPFGGDERPIAVFVHPPDGFADGFIAERIASLLGFHALPRTAELCEIELDLRHCPSGIRQIEAGARLHSLLERHLTEGKSIVCEDLPFTSYAEALETCARMGTKVISIGDERSTRFSRSAPAIYRRGIPGEGHVAGMTAASTPEAFIAEALRLCASSRL